MKTSKRQIQKDQIQKQSLEIDKIFDRKKIFVIFSSLKSKTSPTQIYLNFNNKAGALKALYYSTKCS